MSGGQVVRLGSRRLQPAATDQQPKRIHGTSAANIGRGSPRPATAFARAAADATGSGVRVLPKHPDLPHPFEPGLVTWG